MSLYRIPSLRSSVGSKSTARHLPPHSSADDGGGGGGGEGGGGGGGEERPSALRSSWISRLNLDALSLPSSSSSPSRPRAVNSPACTATEGGGGGGGSGAATALAIGPRRHSVSTDESRTPTSAPNLCYLGAFGGRRPPLLAPFRADREREVEMVAGFGPFRLMTRKTYGEGGGGGGGGGGRREIFPLFKRSSHLGGSGSSSSSGGGGGGGGGGEPINYLRCKEKWESEKKPIDGQSGYQLSPFFRFRPPLNPSYVVHGRVEEPPRLSGENGLLGPVSEENVDMADRVKVSSNGIFGPPLLFPSFSQRRLIDAPPLSQRPHEQLPLGDQWHASTSAQPASQSIGAPYHSDGANNAPSQPFHDPRLVHYPMIPRHPERQTPTCMNQHEEPFSFWNMGRFRTNTISSVSPSIALPSNLARKRNSNTNDFLPSKSRKLCGGS